MSQERGNTAGAESPVWGFDALRLTAMAVVALRHAVSISGMDNSFISPHLGVPVFSALGGFLALRSGGGDALGWLLKRLQRLYISYWICLTAIFVSNSVVGYKAVSRGLIACQYLGVAYFTHPGKLLAVHTWFISLILTCYVVAALIRWERGLLPVFLAAALALASVHSGDRFWEGVLAFLAGGVVARTTRVRIGSACVAVACLAATHLIGNQFLAPLSGTLALFVGSCFTGDRPRPLALASRINYEFYLVHAPVYLELSRLAGLSLTANLIFGTPLAVAAACCLYGLRAPFSQRSRRRSRPLCGGGPWGRAYWEALFGTFAVGGGSVAPDWAQGSSHGSGLQVGSGSV